MLRPIVFMYIVIGVLTGCAEMPVKKQPIKIQRTEKITYKDVNFAVLSDTHLLDKSLFDIKSLKNLKFERKYVEKSDEVFGAALDQLRLERIKFLIISGDLTKDGEKKSHERIANYLTQLKNDGINSFVIPGNHDVNNGNSKKYKGNRVLRTENVSGKEFEKIYKDFGYGEAVQRDVNSLSYVAEPVEDTWLMCIDSNKWRENLPGLKPQNSGFIYPDTFNWMENVLIEAKKKNKAVIAVMHHGLVEHYTTNKKYYNDYLVENGDAVAELFAKYGVKVVFTGHFHAQDITEKKIQTETQEKSIYDIETGSLVNWPAPYRVVEIRENKMKIRSEKIRHIPSDSNFEENIKKFTFESGFDMSYRTIKRFGIMDDEARKIAASVADAYLKVMGGDEDGVVAMPDMSSLSILSGFALKSRGDLIRGWSTDLYPADNDVEIDLNK